MSPEPASLITTGASQAINAARSGQRLAKFGDQDLIGAIDALGDKASRAGKEIIDKADWILTEAKICRWDNDDDVHALLAEIEHYLSDHPRLESLKDSLSALPPLLRALQTRARKLRPEPRLVSKRDKRVDAVTEPEKALKELLTFVERLPGETAHLPAKTGIAAQEMLTLRGIIRRPAAERLAAADDVAAAVASGKRDVANSRTHRISGMFTVAMSAVREAFD